MNLKELLQQKTGKSLATLQGKEKKPLKKLMNQFINTKQEERSGNEENEIEYISHCEKPDEEAFFLSWVPFIKNPYSYDWKLHLDYLLWLTSGKRYVLNTFTRLDTNSIYLLYMEYNPPKDIHQLWRFSWFLNNLDLSIPSFYQQRIEDLIKSISFDTVSEMP